MSDMVNGKHPKRQATAQKQYPQFAKPCFMYGVRRPQVRIYHHFRKKLIGLVCSFIAT